jgi:hypothetical protein
VRIDSDDHLAVHASLPSTAPESELIDETGNASSGNTQTSLEPHLVEVRGRKPKQSHEGSRLESEP